MNPNSEIYVMGDFNIDMLDKKSQNMRDLIRVMKMIGALPLVDKFTRNSENPTCIDQIFTDSNVISSSGITDLNISDHLFFFVQEKNPPRQIVRRILRSYRAYIKEDFQSNLLDLDRTPFYNATYPIVCWDIMEVTSGLKY